MNIYVIAGYLVISGVLLSIVVFLLINKLQGGRINWEIFTPDRFRLRGSVKPASNGSVRIRGKTYLLHERAVTYVHTWPFLQLRPVYSFHEQDPAPLNIYSGEKKNEEKEDEPFDVDRPRSAYSAEEFTSILEDSTVRDFVSAQSSIQPKQIISAIIVMGIAIVGSIVLATYYIVSDGTAFNFTTGG